MKTALKLENKNEIWEKYRLVQARPDIDFLSIPATLSERDESTMRLCFFSQNLQSAIMHRVFLNM